MADRCPLPVDWLEYLERRTPDLAQQLERHLEGCAECQELVLVLREESLGFRLAPYTGPELERARAALAATQAVGLLERGATGFHADEARTAAGSDRGGSFLERGDAARALPIAEKLGRRHLLLLLPVALVLLNDLLTPGLLDWFPSHAFGFSWFAVTAVAILSFSGAYCATKWRSPSLLAFALAFLALTFYVVAVASAYEGDEAVWRGVWRVGWLGIPLAVAFWARSAVLIGDETRFAGRGETAPTWNEFRVPSVVVRTLPALLRRRLIEPHEQLVRWEEDAPAPARRLARRLLAGVTPLELLAVWLPALVFVGAGAASHLMYGLDAKVEAAWRGHTYVPHAGHWVMSVWIGFVLLSTTVYLWSAFRGRPSGLSIAVDRRAQYACVASGAFFVLAGLLLASSVGVVPEPLGDLVLTIYACLLALVIVDAEEAEKPRRQPRLSQRLAVVVATTAGVVAAVASIGAPPARAAILGCVLGAAVPLAGRIGQWLNPPDLAPAVPGLGAAVDEGPTVRSLLDPSSSSAHPRVRPETLVLASKLVEDLKLGGADAARAPQGSERTEAPLGDFGRLWLRIPKRHDKETRAVELTRPVRAMLQHFPALDALTTTERAHDLIRITFSTARGLAADRKELDELLARDDAPELDHPPRDALEMLMSLCRETDVLESDPAPDDAGPADMAMAEDGFRLVYAHWGSSLEQRLEEGIGTSAPR